MRDPREDIPATLPQPHGLRHRPGPPEVTVEARAPRGGPLPPGTRHVEPGNHPFLEQPGNPVSRGRTAGRSRAPPAPGGDGGSSLSAPRVGPARCATPGPPPASEAGQVLLRQAARLPGRSHALPAPAAATCRADERTVACRASARESVEAFEQVVRLALQRRAELQESPQADLTSSALDPADLDRRKSSLVREVFLRPAVLVPRRSYEVSEPFDLGSVVHLRIVERLVQPVQNQSGYIRRSLTCLEPVE